MREEFLLGPVDRLGVLVVIAPAMTSLGRYLEEAAFNISISSSVFIFLWLFSRPAGQKQ